LRRAFKGVGKAMSWRGVYTNAAMAMIMLYRFAAHSLPSLVSWLGSHTDKDMKDIVCALLGHHNDESIIAFPVDGFIQKADGFAGVFPGKSCAASAYLPLLII
nr:plasma membrane ATPase 1-like isoform X1 [Tanacetum cinerariifolium]